MSFRKSWNWVMLAGFFRVLFGRKGEPAKEIVIVDITEVQDRLIRLAEYLPAQSQITYEFAAYLAQRLHNHLKPWGFAIVVLTVAGDLERGVSYDPLHPIPRQLLGQPLSVYQELGSRAFVILLAECACPEEFASAVKQIYENIKKQEDEVQQGS